MLPLYAPDLRLWAFDSLVFAPSWMRGLSVILLVLALLLPFLRFSKKSKPVVTKGSSNTSMKITVAIVLILAAITFPVNTFFLGNSTDILFRLFNVLQGRPFEEGVLLSTQPASAILYLEFSKFLFHSFEVNPVDLFWAIGILCSIPFVILSVKFSSTPDENTSASKIFLATILSMPTIIFFFGYPEYYTIMLVLLLGYFFSVDQYLRGESSLWLSAVLLFLAISFHVTAALLVPTLLFLLGRKFFPAKTTFRVVVFGIGFAVLLGFMYYFLTGKYRGESFFIPIFNDGVRSDYSLFSLAHLIDILNLIGFYLFPVIIIIGSLLFPLRKKLDFTSPKFLLGLLAIAFPLMFIGIWNSLLGMARDWDVGAFFGISGVVALIFILRSANSSLGHAKIFVVPSICLSMSVIIPWVHVHTSTEAGVQRFGALLAMDAPHTDRQGIITGYENLRKYYEALNDTEGEITVVEKIVAISLDPYDVTKLAIACKKAATSEVADRAMISAASKLWELKTYLDTVRTSVGGAKATIKRNFFQALLECVKYYLQSHRINEASSIAKNFIQSFPNSSYGYVALAHCSNAIREYESSYNYSSMALQKPDADNEAFYYRGYAEFKLNRLRESEQSFNDAMRIDPDDMMPKFGLGLLYLEGIKDTVRAIRHFEDYLQRNSRTETADRIRNILNSIKR